MRFSDAIDLYVVDMRSQGRINSAGTETAYRQVLAAHADDVANRDPAKTGRDDVKRTLRRWTHPNTQASRHAALNSFYDWAMEEGYRKDNPARQVRRAKRRETKVYRLTRTEAAAVLHAARSTREIRISHLGICAGIRNAELRGMQGRHFHRPGFVWVSPDIGKGGRERWVPILDELAPVVDEMLRTTGPDEHILPASKWGGYGDNVFLREDPTNGMSSQTLQRTVHRLAARAGIAAHVHPHLLRHAFADHVARFAGLKQAQSMLGHADVGTTQGYVGQPTLEELAEAIKGLRFAPSATPLENTPQTPKRRGRDSNPRFAARNGSLAGIRSEPALERLLAPLAPAVAVYAAHFSRGEV